MAGKSHSGLQNRVDPSGNLHAVTAKGAWMGNRGELHNENKEIVKPWEHYHWVTCLLEDGPSYRKGATAREKLFTVGNYSELFFLDEATAFAAGHRPCASCRDKRYKEFKEAWIVANRKRVKSDNPSFKEMDKVLQEDRATEERGKNTFDEQLEKLPAGTMIELNGNAYLWWRERLFKWDFKGYSYEKTKVARHATVCVLTPKSIVLMFTKGFVPQVHVSAFW